MFEAHPDFDPHGLKAQGETSAKSAHVNEPYVFVEFPKVLVKKVEATEEHPAGTLNVTVFDKEGEDKAKGEGFAEMV